MPFITVLRTGFGADNSAAVAQYLARMLVAVCLRTKTLGLKTEDAVSVSFPVDALPVRQSETVIVKVEMLFDKPERTLEVREELARNIFEVVHRFFMGYTPGGVEHQVGGRPVEVAVLPPFDPARDAFVAG